MNDIVMEGVLRELELICTTPPKYSPGDTIETWGPWAVGSEVFCHCTMDCAYGMYRVVQNTGERGGRVLLQKLHGDEDLRARTAMNLKRSQAPVKSADNKTDSN